MLRIFDSLKSLISPELVTKASAILGEDSTKVSTAIPTVLASLLGALLHKGDTAPVKSVLEDAGKSNILTDLNGIFSDNISMKQKSVGNDFLSAILGTKRNEFDGVVAATSGLTTRNAGKLTSMIAPIVAGFLGNKLATNGYSMSGLLNQLNEEKHSFMGFIPSGIANVFGLSSVSDLGAKVGKYTDSKRTVYETPEKKGSGWWKWLLLIILLLLLFFWWRSCHHTPAYDYVEYDETYVAPDTTAAVQPYVSDWNSDRDSADFDLPNGKRINAYKGGIEDDMISYLKSDNYKNASADDLKKKRFEFDNITFAYGSASELTGNSRKQVNNIIEILKDYPDVKVRIVGNADKKGSDSANMSISQQRAKYIESLLENGGVGKQVVKTEGAGDEYADHSANESDAARAEDRDVFLYFVK